MSNNDPPADNKSDATESTGSAVLDEINAKLEVAGTREQKLAILREYMSEDQAAYSIGLVMGEHDGDVVGRSPSAA